MKPFYQDDLTTIYCGDCRKILPELDPVDVVITDPPYFGYKIDEAEAEVRAEYSANVAVGLYLASRMAPAMVLVTSPKAGAALEIVRELPFVETFCWDCQEESVAVHTFGEGRIGTWNGLVGGPRIPIPVEVISALYKPFRPGTVLDPFMGSGTTLQAVRGLGARSIGIEISKERCEQAAQNLQALGQLEGRGG